MDVYAIIAFLMGVALGFLRRGKEERAKILEVLVTSMFLGLISAIALSYLVLDDAGLGEFVRTFGLVVAAITYVMFFIAGTYIGDILEKFRK
ncbi:MAG: hypothetical protein H0Z19_08345 [Archaeoglobus sp.]|uniref:hypothetical protein n=1 Tax=Archaeoglobus sp. TaxID=1872626 RepID=UPI001D72134D|nr:hypothetical protein [Archaeoglobus sp.]MBO8180470.1 hypothetical protein [Archaeoglobus sp.]